LKTLNIVLAPDKFRGSLESDEVCDAMTAGILLAFPHATITAIPLADGGEGTAKALTLHAGGRFVSVEVKDPLGRPRETTYGLSADQKTAFIEMASASGLALLTEMERNPDLTTSYGTGQLMVDALDRGVEDMILGIGGSATTDGGTGIAAALGYRFLDETGQELAPNGENLRKINSVDASGVHPRLATVKIRVACDVTNPLYGEQGAAYIYGPQKGATPEQVVTLDQGLRHLSVIATKTFGTDFSESPGAGAAGGVGAGALWFLNATLQPGAAIVLQQTQIETHIKVADLVITGEGKMDQQTLQGKLVLGLADVCVRHKVPLAAVCGTLAVSPQELLPTGITYAVSAIDRPMSLEVAQLEAFSLVRQATFQLVRLFFSSR
jgi:glycerate kinase